MKKAAIAVLLSGVALSSTAFAGNVCHVPKSQWKSKAAMAAELKKMNWHVKHINVDEGCYEVYATDQNGKRQEMFFNPATLKMLHSEK